MTRFIDDYDCAMFDLDGVVYLGPEPVVGAPESIADLRQLGVRVGFVTNNAGRSPEVVVAHLNELGIECHQEDVVTSAQAIAQLMARELPTGAKLLVCGAQALVDEVTAVGFTPVGDFTEGPDAVVQGYDPQMTFPRLEDAAFAIQRGARWYASNTDINRPTNLGISPGAGAQIAAIQVCVDVEPIVAGKPYPPLLQETIKRMGAVRPVFVGDRLDTDIEGAQASGIDSLFVLSGSHGKTDLVVAPKNQRPTYIGLDLSALLDEPVTGVSGSSTATVRGQLERLWVIARECWAAADRGEVPDRSELDQLTLLP